MKRMLLVLALGALCVAPAAAAPPTVTLKASPTVVQYGGSTTLSGVLSTGRAGESVDILAQECGQTAFKKVATATTTTGGNFTVAVKPTLNTNYEAKQKGATSTAAAVKVSPLVTAKKLSLGKFRVSVTAAQSFVGKYVVFQRLRNTKWVSLKKVTLKTVATTTAPTQVSSATFRIKLAAKRRVRAILPQPQAGSCYLAAKSKTIRS
jgi:hypothetical protein